MEIKNAVKNLSLTAFGPDGILNEILSYLVLHPCLQKLLLKTVGHFKSSRMVEEREMYQFLSLWMKYHTKYKIISLQASILTNCICKLLLCNLLSTCWFLLSAHIIAVIPAYIIALLLLASIFSGFWHILILFCLTEWFLILRKFILHGIVLYVVSY